MSKHKRGKKQKPKTAPNTSIWRLPKLLVGVFVAVIGYFALFAPPSIKSQAPVFYGQPMSLVFDIMSRTVLPLIGLNYDCEPNIAMGGNTIRGLKMSHADQQDRTLYWYGTTTARCEHTVRLEGDVPIKNAEMKVNIRYWQPPWFLERHQSTEFVLIIDPHDGKTYRWVHK